MIVYKRMIIYTYMIVYQYIYIYICMNMIMYIYVTIYNYNYLLYMCIYIYIHISMVFPISFPASDPRVSLAAQITERAKFSTKAVVIGGGLLGLEAAKVGGVIRNQGVTFVVGVMKQGVVYEW